jgi:hypothetical protein
MASRDYAAVTRELLAADCAPQSLTRLLERRCPELTRQIAADKARPAILRLWGQSRNIDENTGRTIVPQPVIQTLGTLAGVEMQHPIVHAGVTHTYGYLFSLIDTPYGFKRERWVRGEVARALGLPDWILSPQPRTGTLLANATYVMGRIAFRGRRRELQTLRTLRSEVPAQLRKFPYADLRGHRIVETIVRSRRTFQIITDLIDPPQPHGTMQLLVYSWSEQGRRARLITAFPVTPALSADLSAPQRFGRNVEITVRFNGHLAPLGGSRDRTYRGTRALYARSARLEPLT